MSSTMTETAETTATESTTATTATATATTTPTDWRAGLTGEFAPLAAEKSLESFKGKDWSEVGPALAKSFVETKRLVGQKGDFKIPGENATPEERASFEAAVARARGVPEKPEGYEIKRPEIALTVGWNEEYEAEFRGLAHKYGLPPAAVQALVDMNGRRIEAERQAVIRHREATKGELRTQWGKDFEARTGRANRALQKYGGDALVDLLAKPSLVPLGDHPLLVKAFAEIADDLIEHGSIPGDGHQSMTPEEASQRIAELRVELQKHQPGSARAGEITEQIITLTRRLPAR